MNSNHKKFLRQAIELSTDELLPMEVKEAEALENLLLRDFSLVQARNLNYLHRLVVKGQRIPQTVQAKIASWARHNDLKNIFSPLADCLEKGDFSEIMKA